ncbi:ArnT family glycosyltransferase [Agrobacterium radiobacter]|uniref:ArnT family glycosyltransferase n=1 Tax=Agrobacterium radiobacter TaxID=362 RepID=UPI003CF00DC8
MTTRQPNAIQPVQRVESSEDHAHKRLQDMKCENIDPSLGGRNPHGLPEWAWIVLLVSLPLFAQFSGAYELFPRPGWVDPMIYVGYFLDPATQIRNLGAYYFSQRIPSVFLGSLFYEIFTPAYAHIALSILFQLIALISIYSIARRIFGPFAAVLSGWWLGANPLWIASVSNGYIDGPAIALSISAIAVLLLANNGYWRYREALLNLTAGFLCACVLALHPIPALLTGVAFLVTVMTMQSTKAFLFHRILSIFIGGLLALLSMAIYSRSIGGPFIFLFHDAHPIRNAFAGNAIPFSRPLEKWLPNTFRIASLFITFVFFALTVYVESWGKVKSRQMALLGAATSIAFFIVSVIWDVAVGGMITQTWFYSSYALIGQSLIMVFIIGSLLADRTRGERFRIFLLSAVFFSMIFFVYFNNFIVKSVDIFSSQVTWAIIFVAGAAILLLILRKIRGVAVATMMILTVIIGIVNLDTRFIFAQRGTVPFRTFFELAIDIRNMVDKSGLNGRRVALWVDRRDLVSSDVPSNEHATYRFFVSGGTIPLNTFDSLAGLWLWDKGTLSFDMPNVSAANEQWLKQPKMPTSLIMVCTVSAICERGHAKLDALNIPSSVRSRLSVWKAGLNPVTVLIVDYMLP